MKCFLSQYPITSFSIMTLAWSNLVWLIILPTLGISATSGSDWFWVGECAPGLSAIILTWIVSRNDGVIKLIKPCTFWRVKPFYYYFVTILLGLFYLSAIGATALRGASIPSIESIYKTTGYFGFLGIKFYGLSMIPILTILYCFCEEIGWRGFALQKLLLHCDGFVASIIIGIVSGIFHIALMRWSVISSHPTLLIFYFIFSVLDSILLSWIYLNTNRSLLLVSMFHAFTDMYGVFSPTILSSLGQGENASTLLIRFLFFFPVYYLMFKNRKPRPGK